MNYVNTKCPRCGVVHNCNFCPNCGLQAPRPANQGYMEPSYPQKPKKGMHGCLIAIIVLAAFMFFIFVVFIISQSVNSLKSGSESDVANMKDNKTELQQVTGVTPNEEAAILEILKSCGLKKIDTITHDDILDDMNEDGETGYRINVDGLNIILYLHKDKTVNIIRYADNNLYAEGEVKSVITDYVLTWQEESDLQIRCQKIIEDILKSPSTAKFPNITKWTMWKQDGEITVQSYVDAQNSFGAELRSEFQFIISTDDYTITSLIFDGEEMINE